MLNRVKKIFCLGLIAFLFLSTFVFAGEDPIIPTIFIRVWQGFDFAKEKIVELKKGDIDISPYGIEIAQPRAEIAALDKGFIEDVKAIPEEEVTDWRNFADYQTGMVYAVRCANGKYALFELLDVKVSNDQVIGVEISYRYQPDGSRGFD